MNKHKSILAVLMAGILFVLALSGNSIGVQAEGKADEDLVCKYYGPVDGVEIPELREEYGKHFRLPDGTIQYVGSTLRQHYLDDFGSFQNIDNTIVEENDVIGDTVYSYVNKDSDIICRFTDSSNSGPYSIHIQYNSCSIGSGLLGTRYQKIDLEDIEALDLLDGFIEPEKTILYSTEDGYYILYYVTPDAVKEYIIINSPDYNEFHFQLGYNNVHPVNTSEGVYFMDENETIFSISGLYAFDSERTCHDVSFSITETDEQHAECVISVPQEWLFDSARQYPVVIDPSITIQSSTSIADAFISSTNNTNNYGSSTLLRTGKTSVFGTCRSAIRFVMPDYIDPSLVILASIDIKKSSGSTPSVTAYAIQGSWNESSITWSNTPSFSSTVHSDTTISATSVGADWYAMWATDMVKGWMNGSITNYGAMMKESGDTSTTKWDAFFSSEAASTNCPQLIINYTLPRAYLLGIPAVDINTGLDHDHSSCLQAIGTELEDIDYTPVYKFTTPTVATLNSTFNSVYTKIFVSRSHGQHIFDSNLDSVLTFIYLSDVEEDYPFNGTVAQQTAFANTYGYTSNNVANCDLSAKKIVLFVGCNTGYLNTGETAPSNLPYKAYLAGAHFAVGFKYSIDCQKANDWIEEFFHEMIENGKTTGQTMTYLSTLNKYIGSGLDQPYYCGNSNETIDY